MNWSLKKESQGKSFFAMDTYMTITVYGETISTKWKFADKSDIKVAIIGLNIHIKGTKGRQLYFNTTALLLYLNYFSGDIVLELLIMFHKKQCWFKGQ